MVEVQPGELQRERQIGRQRQLVSKKFAHRPIEVEATGLKNPKPPQVRLSEKMVLDLVSQDLERIEVLLDAILKRAIRSGNHFAQRYRLALLIDDLHRELARVILVHEVR